MLNFIRLHPYNIRLLSIKHVGLATFFQNVYYRKQKATMCFHGASLFTGIATGLSEADPINPATVPGKVASKVVEEVIEKMSA